MLFSVQYISIIFYPFTQFLPNPPKPSNFHLSLSLSLSHLSTTTNWKYKQRRKTEKRWYNILRYKLRLTMQCEPPHTDINVDRFLKLNSSCIFPMVWICWLLHGLTAALWACGTIKCPAWGEVLGLSGVCPSKIYWDWTLILPFIFAIHLLTGWHLLP